MIKILDAEGLGNASDVALQHKGLVLLQQLPPVVCRSIDTAQTDFSSLDASECGLTEFCLLEGESGLQQLELARNSIAAVLPCHTSRLAALTHLCLAHNRLADVSGCARLTALEVLRLGNNKLTSSSLQPLAGLSWLQVLDVHRNSLGSLAPLAALSSLAVLNAAANQLQQLPCLTALTALTELNLRRNRLTSLVSPTAAAGSAAATLLTGAAALPSSLVRLSLARNKLAQAGLLLPLRQLPLLADLCADGNPFGAGSSRDDVLACCPPSLIMLDMQTVSPVERVLILTTAAKLTAAQRSTAAAAAGAAEHAASPANAAPGELAVRTVQAKQRAGKCSTSPAVCREKWQQSCGEPQPQEFSSQQHVGSGDSSCQGHLQQELASIQQHEEPQQQRKLSQAVQLMRISQQTASSSGIAAAGASALAENIGGNQPHSTATAPTGRPASTCCSSADAAGGGSSAASVVALFRPSIAEKLRPHSAGGVLMGVSHVVAQSASGDGSRDSTGGGSLARAGWPRAQSCIGAAAYRKSSSSRVRVMRADREHRSLSTAAAHAAAIADGPAANLADLETDALSSSGWLAHEPENLAEATVLSHCQDAEHGISCRSSAPDTVAEPPAGPATAQGAGAGSAACEQAATRTGPAQAAAATPSARSARYEGALAFAAAACGITLPGVDATASTAQLQTAANAASSKCRSAWEWGIEVYGVAGNPAAAGSGADISAQELEEKYLQAKQATLADRHSLPQQQRVVAPLPPPAEPGVSLTGSRLVLTGSTALGALRGQALAHVGEVMLEHMHYSKVMAALPLLAGLSRLSSLSLRQLSGLQVLPQLHPLLQLTGLRHLMVEDCPLAGLVLLRPYVAFRLSGLLSFNGVPISQCEVLAAAELFGPLEAALAVALAQAPQQAALAASGVIKAKDRMLQQPGGSLTTGSSGPAATVWCTSSSGGWQHMAGGNSSSCRPAAPGDTAAKKLSPAAGSLLQADQQQGKCETLTATSIASTATSHSAPAASSAPASIGVMSRVLAAMPAGPLLPSDRCMSQGAAFASQLLAEAAGVQQQLAVLHEQAWPVLVEQSIHEGWYGHHNTGTVGAPR